jgi:hypothetical protein
VALTGLGVTLVRCASEDLVAPPPLAPVPCVVEAVQAPTAVQIAPPSPGEPGRRGAGGYQILSMKYSGPPNIVPFNFRISSAPDKDNFVDAKLGGPDCEIDHLFATTLAAWSRHRGGQPYTLGSMAVGMASNGGGCRETQNFDGKGRLEVSYIRPESPQVITRSFVRPCRQGLIYVCVGDLLDAALESLNGDIGTPQVVASPDETF